MSDFLEIDGSEGEGGGQIVRTSLALSACTGRPVAIRRIRAGRKKPGLMRQHLTSAQAAARVCSAQLEGAAIGATEIEFRPNTIAPGEFRFAVGSAGSTTLVLQTVLPPLLRSGGVSTVEITGGTHNPWSPPFDFLARSFLPLLQRFGVKVEAELKRPGFFPAGGGQIRVRIEAPDSLRPTELLERGEVVRRRAVARIAELDHEIAERELGVVRRKLGFRPDELELDAVRGSLGPGNVIAIEHECEHVTEVHTGFGERGVKAERVAGRAVNEARQWLASGVPVGEHLADQLLIPMALAGRGAFRTQKPTLHTTTNCEVIERFLPVRFDVTEDGDAWVVRVAPR